MYREGNEVAERGNLKVEVENFGPVREGEFELKPLTIFIGPNNSGKSYMALSVYVLSQTLLGRQIPFRGWAIPPIWFEQSQTQGQDVNKWLKASYKAGRGKTKALTLEDVPQPIYTIFRELLESALRSSAEDLERRLCDYFGCRNAADLVRRGPSGGTLTVRLNEKGQSPPLVSFRLEPENGKPVVQCALPEASTLRLGLFYPEPPDYFPQDLRWLDTAMHLWRELLDASGVPAQGLYYLPAARSGILQGWHVLMSAAVGALRPSIRRRRIELPEFSGAVVDFLQVLLEPGSRPRGRKAEWAAPALEILERAVFNGEVLFTQTRSRPPAILYRSSDLELPLERASSMVGELAPLDLWIKYILSPGDLLIMDEPEAHLHPEAQRGIARVLVRLVRAGVRVLCTTHSSTILHQVSNHLLAAAAPDETRRQSGFTEHDLLKEEEVAVYLFDMREEEGTHIKPVPIEPGFGISEEEFLRVAEAIGDETYRLSASTVES
ncbi:MAG: AAA family ATPase [Chloroflexi bacterium]|nr:AAA family ATPase [Chloroflexota bacterium]